MEKNCLNRCQEMMPAHPRGRILKIFNKKDPWGDNPMDFGLEHLMGFYKFHFVVEERGEIFDPFLDKPISREEYLREVYKNYKELGFAD